MKRFVFATLIALMSVFLLVGVPHAHAQPSTFNRGWCTQEGCDSSFQDSGNANCSIMQTIVTQQTLHDQAGRAFATGYIFDSNVDNSNQAACHSVWGGMAFLPGAGLHRDDGAHIGTLNTQVFAGDELSGIWISTPMLAEEDRSGTCTSAWWLGVDIINNIQSSYSIKLIGGGQKC